jgi:RNA polymerase sigma factor (sigma-70 family)
MVFGSDTIVSLLTTHALIDEYRLLIKSGVPRPGTSAGRSSTTRGRIRPRRGDELPVGQRHASLLLRTPALTETLHEHLFRCEAGRMVAALTRIFGVHNLALVEDVVQDAFCRAVELWNVRGVPENPTGWLMATARNRALDVLRRQRTARQFAPELGRLLDSEWTRAPAVDEAFADHVIRDEQLRMMFSCCHPRLPETAQLALILNILCGFSAGEVAAAFLESRPAIEKRISRGKKVLADAARLFQLTDAQFTVRLSVVRRALYLLFSEGYHGASPESAVRTELCHEAIRLTGSLTEHAAAGGPETNALAALMCLHAARLPARCGAGGALTSLFAQCVIRPIMNTHSGRR